MKCSRSFLLISAWLLAQGCDAAKSSDAASSNGGVCVGVRCQSGQQSKDQYEISLGAGAAGVAGVAGTFSSATPAMPALCAVRNPTCDPDDATSCNNAVPSVGVGGATNAFIPSATLNSAIDSGLFTAAGTSGGPNAVSNAGAGGAGYMGYGGSGGNPAAGTAGKPTAALACRVQRDVLPTRTTCEPAGTGTFGAPCLSRANCAAGLACVDENGTAQCRPYCCHGVGSCPLGTYCDQRSTKELVATPERLTVSVCLPAVECRFDDPYPCPTDRSCSCPAGKTCGVVRADGTTACVTPGAGTEGQPCPCVAGHVCSGTLGSCFKVCSLTSSDSGCVNGFCQSSESLSPEWGICVGPAALL